MEQNEAMECRDTTEMEWNGTKWGIEMESKTSKVNNYN